jgi:cytidine deaminase
MAKSEQKGRNSSLPEETLNKLIELCVDAKRNSYSPYSHFRVGCALLTDDGRFFQGCQMVDMEHILLPEVFQSHFERDAPIAKDRPLMTALSAGCNVENSSYGLTICAERTALTKAVSEGYRSFRAIAVSSDLANICPPCGACRQFIAEVSKC